MFQTDKQKIHLRIIAFFALDVVCQKFVKTSVVTFVLAQRVNADIGLACLIENPAAGLK